MLEIIVSHEGPCLFMPQCVNPWWVESTIFLLNHVNSMPADAMTPCVSETSVSEWVIKFNTLRPGQDGRHFSDDIFKCIFINENCCVLIKCSLKYVRKDPIDNNPALVQIMAWHRSGDKLLSEPMMISLPTHICVTRPQWVNSFSWTAGSEVHIVYISHVIIAYTLE